MIDLGLPRPRLYVVEIELAAHDPLRHVAVQILQFSLSFKADPRIVKNVLFDALEANPKSKELCERYTRKNGFRNLDHFLDFLSFESPFAALVIIDELVDDLENVLLQEFQFGVEVIEVGLFQNTKGKRTYLFEPFLAQVGTDLTKASGFELDTVVVPARSEGFQETFLRENRWYAVRIHGTMRPQIKFIAGYQTAPISAITHFAPVKSIEPWKDTEKVVVKFSEPAKEISPIPLAKRGRVKGLQNLRYTSRERLEAAKTLDDIW